MWEDPIVAEVRRVRAEVMDECGNDLDELFRRAVKIQNEYENKSDVAADRTARGAKMVEALEKPAATNAFPDITDPSEWQREQREE